MRKVQILLLLIIPIFKSHAQNMDEQSQNLIKRAEIAMGGQEAFDNIQHISWNFFGVRNLTWDKYSGDVRIDLNNENTVYLVNTKTKEGRVFKNGEEYTQPDSLQKYLKTAYEIWINDSYWLVMPFKMDDPGVSSKYLKEKATQNGEAADVIELTFNETGVTPDNKYHIYFDKNTGLVTQWDFFRNYSDEKPMFSLPWQNYVRYGSVLLSGDRGERKLSDIKVFKKLPKTVYTEFKRPFYLK
ncbi:hypothetical protein [Jiulongibacter sediminis]|uniref:hypothetical protein n=1 Tax=Jiulongibacter sediminis TaxID=1605367 RepID=UPI0026EB17BB|nr:hypothetical protein [Jiulongibacter sediminis]